MPIWKQQLFRRYQVPANGEGGTEGGTGTGEGGSGAGSGEGENAATAAAAAAAAAAALALASAGKPSDTEAKLLKEVMQRKEALKKTSDDLTAAQARLKEFEGIDPVTVRQMMTEKSQADEKALEAAGEWTRLKERMATEHASNTKSLQEKINELTSTLQSKDGTINELSIGTNFSQSPFISTELVLTPAKARVVYGNHFDLVDGKVVGYDKPRGSSNRTPLVDESGSELGFDAAMKKIVEADPDKDHMLKSKVKPGAGSNSSAKPASGSQKAAATDSLSRIGAGLSALKIITR